MSSSTEPNVITSLFQQVGEYAETRAELLKLTAVDKASDWISLAAMRAAIYVIASRAVLFLSIGAGFLLGEWLGSYSYGFFLVSIAFVLVGILVYIWRSTWVKDPVAKLIITKMLE